MRGKQDEQLTGLIYDKQYECNRKYELEKYMMRNKVDTDREKMLINEIHRL